jgi:2,4-dichlorophenol 6-monooxygenase
VIAEQLGQPFGGEADIAGSMNIVFRTDLSHLVAHRPSVLYWVLQPGSNIGGIGMGLVRMVRPWDEWLIVWGYDIAGPAPEMDDARARAIAHNLIGDQDVDIEILSTSLWTNNRLYAERYSEGRVFCLGDAVHRHPPSNGLGSNTSVADAYNLAWKLAHVLRGQADPSLLRTYDVERQPVGEQIVKRANQSIEEFGPIFHALGLLDTDDPDQMVANMAARKDATPRAAAQRDELRAAIELKNYEFNAHGVELGQRYRSAAVADDGSPEPPYERDAELYFHATTWPGARLPHCWVGRDGRRVSTLDLCGRGRFTLLTAINGAAHWRAAVEALDVDVAVVVIGPGQEVEDLYDDWARLREVGETGCVLVRPDMHVGWRSHDEHGDLAAALAQILGRS